MVPSATVRVWSSMGFSTVGIEFMTVTMNSSVALSPSGSVAVTVIVASPLFTAVIVRLVPIMLTVATATSEDLPMYSRSSSSGSVKVSAMETIMVSSATVSD